jgi:hypothetical protein
MGLEKHKHILWTLNVLVAIAIHYAPSKEKAFALFVEMAVLNVIELSTRPSGGGRNGS